LPTPDLVVASFKKNKKQKNAQDELQKIFSAPPSLAGHNGCWSSYKQTIRPVYYQRRKRKSKTVKTDTGKERWHQYQWQRLFLCRPQAYCLKLAYCPVKKKN
jgi:hypothetical protein